MKNIMALIILFLISSAYVVTPHKPSKKNNTNVRLDYLVGEWYSQGFVTSSDGLQQYLTMNQTITHLNTNDIQIVGTGTNPTNGFRYNSSKTIFYDNNLGSWHVRGTVKDKYRLDTKVDITESNIITYTFYDGSKKRMRYTITKESDNAFTEAEEIWANNGWDKTAWLRSNRIPKSYNTVASRTNSIGLKGDAAYLSSYNAVAILEDRPIH